jgi:hypothetical protein
LFQDEKLTEPGNKHSSGSKEKALDEIFTEPDNKYYSGLKHEVLDKAFTGPASLFCVDGSPIETSFSY